jgi:ribosomal protein S18 acetylase RimI-like enzyme
VNAESDLEYLIRPATLSDAAKIIEFNCRLASETEHMTLDPTRIGPGVHAVLADAARGRYFVAEFEGQVIGQVMHTWEWSDWRNGEIWWLQSVYVAPDHRGRQVFRRLWNHVAQLAEQRPDVVGLRLYVEGSNQSARSTYAKLGMKETGYLVMERFFDRTVPQERPGD